MLANVMKAIRGNPKLVGIVVVLFVVQGVLQGLIDPLRRQPAIEPKSKQMTSGIDMMGAAGIPFEYSLAALTGFRQVIAGLLWVRTDSFFHSGNYDAILPMLRLITWLDPNWIDVYATGAWHMMYNFTDTDQRSDRRYLPLGIALLNEGIANNSNLFDLYKEKGWNYFDKIKDYQEAIKAYEGGRKADPNHDISQVEHLLAHSLDRNGQPKESIAMWQTAADEHMKRLNDPKVTADAKGRNQQGYNTALSNLRIMKVRDYVRPRDVARLGPVDANLHVKVTRIRPRVIEVSGEWNLIGCIDTQYDDTHFDAKGNLAPGASAGIVLSGPVDGARMDIRLQDAGYVMPDPREFSFEVPSDVTIMQESLSVRGGRQTAKGSILMVVPNSSADQNAQRVMIYNYKQDQVGPLKPVALDKALASGLLSPFGQLQLVSYVYPPAMNRKKFYTQADVPALLAKVKADSAKIAELTRKGFYVSQGEASYPANFGVKREIDMSKDPKMYSFAKPEYDLIISFNPRTAPDFVQDRIGWNGEGLSDKQFLLEENGLRKLYVKIKLTKEQLLGTTKEVLFEK